MKQQQEVTTEQPRPLVLLRKPQVKERTGLSDSSIYELMMDGRFPKNVKVGKRTVAWVEAEVEAYIRDCIAQRDKKVR